MVEVHRVPGGDTPAHRVSRRLGLASGLLALHLPVTADAFSTRVHMALANDIRD